MERCLGKTNEGIRNADFAELPGSGESIPAPFQAPGSYGTLPVGMAGALAFALLSQRSHRCDLGTPGGTQLAYIGCFF